jgi:hypothetical protein
MARMAAEEYFNAALVPRWGFIFVFNPGRADYNPRHS